MHQFRIFHRGLPAAVNLIAIRMISQKVEYLLFDYLWYIILTTMSHNLSGHGRSLGWALSDEWSTLTIALNRFIPETITRTGQSDLTTHRQTDSADDIAFLWRKTLHSHAAMKNKLRTWADVYSQNRANASIQQHKAT